jgi:tetrapyrrole methylase family protein/MazG family protein/ATP diphosphatase
VRTAGQVLEQWELIKAKEQKEAGERRSLLRGVPKSLPSLLRAHEIGTRVSTVGFDWAKTTDVMDKIEEELSELRQALTEGSARTEEEMGDLLFSIANLARKLGIEPESALRKANEKFSARFERLEHGFEARERSIHDATLDEMEAEWHAVKSSEVGADAKVTTTALTTTTATVELNAPTAIAKKRRSEEPKATGLTRRTRAGRAPAGGRRQK